MSNKVKYETRKKFQIKLLCVLVTRQHLISLMKIMTKVALTRRIKFSIQKASLSIQRYNDNMGKLKLTLLDIKIN